MNIEIDKYSVYTRLFEQCLVEKYIEPNSYYKVPVHLLIEERGVNKDITNIVNIMYKKVDVICRNVKFDDNNMFVYKFVDLNVGDDNFLFQPCLTITLHNAKENSVVSSSYIPDMQTPIFSNRLYQAEFSYEQNTNSKGIDYELFMKSMTHEIMHSYRYYSLIVKNNYTFPSSEIVRRLSYKNFNTKLNTDKDFDQELLTKVKDLCYASDKDEIGAEGAAYADFLQRNTDINFNNYQKKTQNTTLMERIKYLREGVYVMLGLSDDEKIEVGEIVNTLFVLHKYNPMKSFNRFIKRLKYHHNYALDQYYKITSTVLSDNNRTPIGENLNRCKVLTYKELKLDDFLYFE